MDTARLGKPKRPNLFDNAPVLSQLFNCWGVQLLVEGNRKQLTEDDVCEPMKQHKSCRCEEQMCKAWQDEINKCKRLGEKPQLVRAVVRLFTPRYMLLSIPCVMLEILPFVQVYLLYKMLMYYSQPVESRVFTDASWVAAGVILCSWGKGYLEHAFNIRSALLGLNVRLAVSTLLYQKVLRISKARKSNISTGYIINLFAIDGKKLEMFFHYSNYLILAPVQLLAVSIVAWFIVGWPAIAGAVFCALILPLQFWITKKCSTLRQKMVGKADIRVRLMNEIISGIQVLKMYAWENPFAEMIFAARKYEQTS